MKTPACFSVLVDIKIANRLREDLINQGFTITTPPYTLFSGKKKGISCTLYQSGKLTVQGKEMAHFIEFYLEPEILKEFKFSHPAALLDLTPRIGLDEAGKGDLFGPLCIAGLYADGPQIQQLLDLGVGDSKTLSDATVQKLAKKIKASYIYTVIRLFPVKYNELYEKFKNLNSLLAWAHAAALGNLVEKTNCRVAILDQFAHQSLVDRQVAAKKIDVVLTQRTKGEEDLVVAGASILARNAFLEGMDELSKEHGTLLPKGASSKVKETARKLLEQSGPEILGKVAKLHFKTIREISL